VRGSCRVPKSVGSSVLSYIHARAAASANGRMCILGWRRSLSGSDRGSPLLDGLRRGRPRIAAVRAVGQGGGRSKRSPHVRSSACREGSSRLLKINQPPALALLLEPPHHRSVNGRYNHKR
jgi:hypothetical protein